MFSYGTLMRPKEELWVVWKIEVRAPEIQWKNMRNGRPAILNQLWYFSCITLYRSMIDRWTFFALKCAQWCIRVHILLDYKDLYRIHKRVLFALAVEKTRVRWIAVKMLPRCQDHLLQLACLCQLWILSLYCSYINQLLLFLWVGRIFEVITSAESL